MRRAAVSVPSNIAEGKGRRSRKGLAHFLYQARGSLLELETQLPLHVISNTWNAITFNNTLGKAEEVGRILNGLVNHLQTQPDKAA